MIIYHKERDVPKRILLLSDEQERWYEDRLYSGVHTRTTRDAPEESAERGRLRGTLYRQEHQIRVFTERVRGSAAVCSSGRYDGGVETRLFKLFPQTPHQNAHYPQGARGSLYQPDRED